MTHVFTYGTLEIPEVMEAVTGKSWVSAEARAGGFAKFLLKGRTYPGMTVVQGSICSGRVYYHLDPQTIEILDAFEDEVYRREQIEVDVEGGRSLQAHAYLIRPQDRECLTAIPWQPDEFKSKHLVRYLEACKAFHREISGRPPRRPEV